MIILTLYSFSTTCGVVWCDVTSTYVHVYMYTIYVRTCTCTMYVHADGTNIQVLFNSRVTQVCVKPNVVDITFTYVHQISSSHICAVNPEFVSVSCI